MLVPDYIRGYIFFIGSNFSLGGARPFWFEVQGFGEVPVPFFGLDSVVGIGEGLFIERGIVNDQQGRLRMEVPCFAVIGVLNDG